MEVKELIDWVIDGIEVEVCCACGGTGSECDNCHYLDAMDTEKLAKQILSHPDLALVKREIDTIPLVVVICPRCGTTHQSEIAYHDLPKNCIPVIPLAEAIKELK